MNKKLKKVVDFIKENSNLGDELFIHDLYLGIIISLENEIICVKIIKKGLRVTTIKISSLEEPISIEYLTPEKEGYDYFFKEYIKVILQRPKKIEINQFQ